MVVIVVVVVVASNFLLLRKKYCCFVCSRCRPFRGTCNLQLRSEGTSAVGYPFPPFSSFLVSWSRISLFMILRAPAAVSAAHKFFYQPPCPASIYVPQFPRMFMATLGTWLRPTQTCPTFRCTSDLPVLHVSKLQHKG